MNRDSATKIFDSLSSGIRLDIWRSLINVGQDGKVAGDLAKELNLAPNSISFHLKALLHAGMVSVEQEGRFQRYRANLPLMLDLVSYLTQECCAGQAHLNKDGECKPSIQNEICLESNYKSGDQ